MTRYRQSLNDVVTKRKNGAEIVGVVDGDVRSGTSARSVVAVERC